MDEKLYFQWKSDFLMAQKYANFFLILTQNVQL